MANFSPKALGEAPVGKLLFSMAMHTTVSLVLNSFYTLADTYFVAQSIGAFAAGGIALATPLLMLLTALSTTVGTGASVLISRALGAGDTEGAARTAANTFLTFWSAAFAFMVLGLTFLEPILKLMGTDPQLTPYTRDYLKIILCGTVFSTGFSSLIRAEGNARYALLIWMIPVSLNIVTDALFLMVFHWGVKGAALSTVLTQMLSCGMSIYYFFFSKRDAYAIRRRHFKPDLRLMGDVVMQGSPALLSQVSGSISSGVINGIFLATGGAAALSAFSVVSRIQSFFVMPQSGVVQGMQPLISYNDANGKSSRVRSFIRLAMGFNVVWGMFALAAGSLFYTGMPGLFINEADVLEIARPAMLYLLFCLPFTGVPMIVSALFQAKRKPLYAILLQIGGVFALRIPLLLLLSHLLPDTGIWLAQPVAEAAICLLAVAALRLVPLGKGEKENKKPAPMDAG